MSARLETFVAVEEVMMRLDDVDDPYADVLRDDVLDPLWFTMEQWEHDWLRGRGDLSRPVVASVAPYTTGWSATSVWSAPRPMPLVKLAPSASVTSSPLSDPALTANVPSKAA